MAGSARFTAILDANVLYPPLIRDTLLSLAVFTVAALTLGFSGGSALVVLLGVATWGLTFGGALNDAEDVIVGTTNASLFAYVADGRNGMKVLQLTSPDSQRNFYGFSPAPVPELIAWAKTPTPAIALSKGLDRDRAVDETGGQMAVFGRLGSRPFTRPEMERLFMTRSGVPWKVSDDVDMKRWVGVAPAGAQRAAVGR